METQKHCIPILGVGGGGGVGDGGDGGVGGEGGSWVVPPHYGCSRTPCNPGGCSANFPVHCIGRQDSYLI